MSDSVSPASSCTDRPGGAGAFSRITLSEIERMKPEAILGMIRELEAERSAFQRQQDEVLHQNSTLHHRLAEQAKEVRLLGAAVSHLAEGILITGDGLAWPGPRIVFVNEAMCRITGYAADELIGQTPRLLQGPATDRTELAAMRADLEAGRPCEIEITNYRKDGTPYPAEMFVTPIFDGEGRHTHYVAIHRDISRRKETEDALISLGRIIEASFNEIYIFDAATMRFLVVNRGARDNLGYTMDELRELTPLDLKPFLDRPGFEAQVEPLLSGSADKIDFECRHRRKDASFYDVQVTLQLTDYRGLRCFVAIVLDTRRRKELEQEVVKASEEERQRIANDLHDDLGSQLTGLKLMIESASCALEERLGEPFDGCAQVLHVVRDAIARTRQIARGLRPVGSDPEDLMGALRGLAERTASASGIRCRFDCPEPVLIGDPHAANHLFRIAQEAVNNSVKHSGCREIGISLAASGTFFQMNVSDDGKGFKRHADRSGLGLHIMNYRAGAMNGMLRIRTRPGCGTRIECVVSKSPDALREVRH